MVHSPLIWKQRTVCSKWLIFIMPKFHTFLFALEKTFKLDKKKLCTFNIFVCQFSTQERKLASDNCLFCWCNLFTPMKIAVAGKEWMVSWNQLSGLMKEDGHWVEWNCLMVYLNSPGCYQRQACWNELFGREMGWTKWQTVKQSVFILGPSLHNFHSRAQKKYM